MVSYEELEIGEMEHWIWMVSYLNVAKMVCFTFGNWKFGFWNTRTEGL
jgi:hypothetical protein